MTIRNSYGLLIDFDSAVNLMDDTIRESIANSLSPSDEQEFFDLYCELHIYTYGETFELDKKNPVW